MDLQRGELREEGKGYWVRDGIHVHYSAKVLIKWARVAGLKHLAADAGIKIKIKKERENETLISEE